MPRIGQGVAGACQHVGMGLEAQLGGFASPLEGEPRSLVKTNGEDGFCSRCSRRSARKLVAGVPRLGLTLSPWRCSVAEAELADLTERNFGGWILLSLQPTERPQWVAGVPRLWLAGLEPVAVLYRGSRTRRPHRMEPRIPSPDKQSHLVARDTGWPTV